MQLIQMTVEEMGLGISGSAAQKTPKFDAKIINAWISSAVSHYAFFMWWNKVVDREKLKANPTRLKDLLTHVTMKKVTPLNRQSKQFKELGTWFADNFDPKQQTGQLPADMKVQLTHVRALIFLGFEKLFAEKFKDKEAAVSANDTFLSTINSLGEQGLEGKLYPSLGLTPGTNSVPLSEEAAVDGAKATKEFTDLVNKCVAKAYFKGKVNMAALQAPPPELFTRPIKEEIISDIVSQPWSSLNNPLIVVVDDTAGRGKQWNNQEFREALREWSKTLRTVPESDEEALRQFSLVGMQ